MLKKWAICLFALCIFAATSASATSYDLEAITEDVGAYLLETVPSPSVGSTGGEWAVIGLARSDLAVDESYFESYYETLVDYLTASDGVLSSNKYTEYSRVILALTAIGADPENVGGYNLLLPLGDYEKTIWQGINGAIWALIALDAGDYEIPENPEAQTQATREIYVSYLLDAQLVDGGWSLVSSDKNADADITAMVLQALANYRDDESVAEAIEQGLSCLSSLQEADGGFSSWGSGTAESVFQVILALNALEIDLNCTEFVRNNTTILDNAMSFYAENSGFMHNYENEISNQMSTEQGFYTLVDIVRRGNGDTGIFDMSDVETRSFGEDDLDFGLANKSEDITKLSVLYEDISFPDIVGLESQTAIENLASLGVITGSTDGNFYPENFVTRAEFSAMIIRALGLALGGETSFLDVLETQWFSPYVGAAFSYGIVSGLSETSFAPNATIALEEASVMLARAAKLCGLETDYSEGEMRSILSQFVDYMTVSDWAKESLAFAYDRGILDDSAIYIEGKTAVTRGELAQMLYALMTLGKLV